MTTATPTNPAALDALADLTDDGSAPAHLVLADFAARMEDFAATAGPGAEVALTAAEIVFEAGVAAARRPGARLVDAATRDWVALSAAAAATGYFFTAPTRGMGLGACIEQRYASLGALFVAWLSEAVQQVTGDPVGSALRFSDAHLDLYGVPDPVAYLDLGEHVTCLEASADEFEEFAAAPVGLGESRRPGLYLVR